MNLFRECTTEEIMQMIEENEKNATTTQKRKEKIWIQKIQ